MVIEYLAAFTGLAGTFKSAADLTKAISDATDDIGIKAKTVELQTQILAAQSSALGAQAAQSALLEQIHSLEAEIAALEAWDAEKQKYDLKAVYPGAYAYAIKPGVGDGEDPHWLCPTCFQQRKKSVFQATNIRSAGGVRGGTLLRWVCFTCQTSIEVSWNRLPGQSYERSDDSAIGTHTIG